MTEIEQGKNLTWTNILKIYWNIVGFKNKWGNSKNNQTKYIKIQRECQV